MLCVTKLALLSHVLVAAPVPMTVAVSFVWVGNLVLEAE